MPTTINASNTTGGAVVTGDGSGILELQSGGVTGITVNGANVTVAGTITSTGGLASPVTVAGNSTAGAEIRLPEDTDNGSNYVALKAPNALAADLTFTLPAADGTNGQYLQTNGAGSLAFATVPTTAPGGTTGQVQINSAGAFGAVAEGTAGQVLTSGGAGVAPTFATPTPSGLTLISAVTASNSATVTFNIPAGYDNFLITIDGVYPETNNVILACRFVMNGTTQTTEYSYGAITYAIPGGGPFVNGAAATHPYIPISSTVTGATVTLSNIASKTFDSNVNLYDASSASSMKRIFYQSAYNRDFGSEQGPLITLTGAGSWNNNTTSNRAPVTGIVFLMSSGNIAAGTFRLYGYAN